MILFFRQDKIEIHMREFPKDKECKTLCTNFSGPFINFDVELVSKLYIL